MLLLLGGSRECDVARPSPVMNLKKALVAYVARSSTGVSNE